MKDQAAAKGIPIDQYLQTAIEDLARTEVAKKPCIEDFRATLDRLAEMGKNLPHVPSLAFGRESITRILECLHTTNRQNRLRLIERRS